MVAAAMRIIANLLYFFLILLVSPFCVCHAFPQKYIQLFHMRTDLMPHEMETINLTKYTDVRTLSLFWHLNDADALYHATHKQMNTPVVEM